MTAPDPLAALALAFLAGDRSAGPPLHDALEEEGWPLEWESVEPTNFGAPYRSVAYLRLPGVCLLGRCVQFFGGAAQPWHWTLFDRSRHREQADTEAAARAAAEAALRRALRGG